MTLPIYHHRSRYLEETNTLDRAKSHLASLNRAEVRGKISAKLSITIRPMVIDMDNPEFKAEWNKAIEAAEKSLIKMLQTHLSRVDNNTTMIVITLLSSHKRLSVRQQTKSDNRLNSRLPESKQSEDNPLRGSK